MTLITKTMQLDRKLNHYSVLGSRAGNPGAGLVAPQANQSRAILDHEEKEGKQR